MDVKFQGVRTFIYLFLKMSQLKLYLFESAMRLLTSYISMTQRSNNLPQRVNLIWGISVFLLLTFRPEIVLKKVLVHAERIV